MRKLALTGLVALAGLAAAAAPASAQDEPPGPCEITFTFLKDDLGIWIEWGNPTLGYAYDTALGTACGPTG
jgi:ABC-type glycerol-3-phosphate transport system substrate-binding protein